LGARERDQRSPRSARWVDCSLFFRHGGSLCGFGGGSVGDVGGSSFGGGGARLPAVLGHVAGFAAEHTELVVEAAFTFGGSEFTVLSELVGEVRTFRS
jgi:hypothetical protein